jgi:hypothetical protein
MFTGSVSLSRSHHNDDRGGSLRVLISPNSSIKDLKGDLLSFGRQKGAGKYQKGVFESLLFRNIDSIPIAGAVSRGKLQVIVEL